MSAAPHDRLLELLAARATDGLEPAEQAELDRLLAEHPEADDGTMELAAGAALLAMAGPGDGEPMPGALRARVLEDLRRDPGAPPLRLAGAPAPAPFLTRVAAWSGWLAAAACLLLVLIVSFGRRPAEMPPEQARDVFLQTAGDVRVAPWGDWDDPEQKGVAGEVAWSESEQTGYMTFRGLAPNNPGEEQYQLWIIDERGLEQRISGGVFNADPDGNLVVEIEPAVEIHGAKAFAITVERPGGVWVSDMDRRVVIAALPEEG